MSYSRKKFIEYAKKLRGIKDATPEGLKALYKTADEWDEEWETPFLWPKENPFIKKGEGVKMTKTEADK